MGMSGGEGEARVSTANSSNIALTAQYVPGDGPRLAATRATPAQRGRGGRCGHNTGPGHSDTAIMGNSAMNNLILCQ